MTTSNSNKWKVLAVSLLALLIPVFSVFLYFAATGRVAWNTRPDSPTVVREVRRLSELATVRYTLQRVVSLTEPKVPLGEESILLMVEGKVIAGVDLSLLKEDDFHFLNNDAVMVKLPPPKLLDVSLNENRTKVWDHHVTWWTPWVPYSPDLEHRARLSALDQISSAAVEMNILGEAKRNARTAIANFLQAVGVKATFTDAT